jgi:hypothetical protein
MGGHLVKLDQHFWEYCIRRTIQRLQVVDDELVGGGTILLTVPCILDPSHCELCKRVVCVFKHFPRDLFGKSVKAHVRFIFIRRILALFLREPNGLENKIKFFSEQEDVRPRYYALLGQLRF